MTDPTENEDTEHPKKKKGDSGEGDSDSWGRGKAGAGAGGIKIPPHKLKEVTDAWRRLDVSAVVAAVAEFFSSSLRASANLAVTWEKTKTNVKSFAIVNWAIEFGNKAAHDLALTRERGTTRDTRGLHQRKPPKARPGINMKLDPSGPNGPTGQ